METKDLEKAMELASLFKIEKILWMILAFILLFFIAKKINQFLKKLIEHMPSNRLLLLQIVTVTNFCIYIFGSFAIIYGILRPPEKLVFAITGSVAVAVGLALKDLVSSIIAGVVLLFDRPFQVGDRVAFKGVYGEIKKIGLRAVRLNTLDDNLITIPNSELMNNYVSSGNAGELDMMVTCKVHTALDVDILSIKSFIYEIAATSKYVYLNKPISINITETEVAQNLAVCFTIKAYVLDVKYEKSFETDIMTRVLSELNKRKVQRPKQQ